LALLPRESRHIFAASNKDPEDSMTLQRLIRAVAVVSSAVATAAGCGGDSGSSGGQGASKDKAAASASAKRTGADRNACDLLTVAEVSAAAGVPVTAKETHRETGRSDCEWDAADGMPRFQLVGYWTGGKDGWDILASSRGMAKDIIQKEEGVRLDSIVKAGPVFGLGDKAFFSPLLPSLVLKGDVLLEFTWVLLPKPEAQFRPLATRAMSRL
jgi:hypothetical protein